MATATVLIVDHVQPVLSVEKAMLSRRYRVLTADSGAAALEVLRTHPETDLVLSEVLLPGMSGRELIDTVKRSFPSTAVMFMAAFCDQPPDPAVPCIQKPFRTEELINRVENMLARSRHQTQTLNEAISRTQTVIAQSQRLHEQTSAVLAEVQDTRRRSRQMRLERHIKANPETAVVLCISPFEDEHTSLKSIFDRLESSQSSTSKWLFQPALTLESGLSILKETRLPIVLCERDLSPGTWRDVREAIVTLPHPPLLIVTSRLADEHLWAEALNLGAYDVLEKPFVTEEAVRVLTSAWLAWNTNLQPQSKRRSSGGGLSAL